MKKLLNTFFLLLVVSATLSAAQVTGKVSFVCTGHAGREVCHFNTLGKTVVTHGAHVDLIIVTLGCGSAAHGGVVPELCIEALAAVQVLDVVYGQVVIGQLACAVRCSCRTALIRCRRWGLRWLLSGPLS